MAGTNAVAWAVGAGAKDSPLPWWPSIAFGALAILGLLVMLSALLRLWPFHRLAPAPAALLDDCIRRGRDAREQIIRGGLDSWAAARVAAEWTLRTANLLHQHYPAAADEFLLAAASEDEYSGQALAIRSLAVKIEVLSVARKGLAS
jgi:hypothetical protein